MPSLKDRDPLKDSDAYRRLNNARFRSGMDNPDEDLDAPYPPEKELAQ